VVYVNSPKKEYFEHNKEGAKRRVTYIGTILAFQFKCFTYINESHLCWKKHFKEEYCTISVLHGTAVKKLDSTGK